MLNREQVIEKYKQDKYYRGVVIGTAALVLRGIIDECRDADIAIPMHKFEYCQEESDAGITPARYIVAQEDELHFTVLEVVQFDYVGDIPVATMGQLVALHQIAKLAGREFSSRQSAAYAALYAAYFQ